MTGEELKARAAMRRAAYIRAGLCLAAVALVGVGAALICLPAGLVSAGLMIYIDCQRNH